MKGLAGFLVSSVMVLASAASWADSYSDTVDLFKKAGQSGAYFRSVRMIRTSGICWFQLSGTASKVRRCL